MMSGRMEIKSSCRAFSQMLRRRRSEKYMGRFPFFSRSTHLTISSIIFVRPAGSYTVSSQRMLPKMSLDSLPTPSFASASGSRPDKVSSSSCKRAGCDEKAKQGARNGVSDERSELPGYSQQQRGEERTTSLEGTFTGHQRPIPIFPYIRSHHISSVISCSSLRSTPGYARSHLQERLAQKHLDERYRTASRGSHHWQQLRARKGASEARSKNATGVLAVETL